MGLDRGAVTLHATMMTADPHNDQPASRTKGSRGPNAERSASMQQRLIEAAITVLRRIGYAAMTTQHVMDEAGVSRGAMLHHFPTRVDLVIAVAEYAAQAQNRLVGRRLAAVPPGMDLYIGITDATWEAVREPAGLALIEIIVASRSDAALGERLPAVVERFEKQQLDNVWEAAQRVGIKDRDAIERMVRLHRAAMRGLAIEMMYSGEASSASAAVELLGWYKRLLTGSLLTEGDRTLFG